MSDQPHPQLTLPGDHCEVHGFHRPAPLRTVRHHIFPQEFGGPSVPDNLVLVCDTGHYNIHAYLDALLKDKELPKATRTEKHLAEQGFAKIKESKA